MAFLAERRTARTQFRSPRRAEPSGCTVLHTSESILDEIDADSGAENVARYMLVRTTPGSYHDLVDSDSWVNLVAYDAEAYQDGTGSNPWGLSLSFACRAEDWPRMGKARRAGFMRQGARAFAAQQQWLAANGHPTTPLRRLTRAQSDARAAGFITHGDRDPARRSDPGRLFPWAEFWAACREATDTTIEPEDDMPTAQEIADEVLTRLVQVGDYGPGTIANAIGHAAHHAERASNGVMALLSRSPDVDAQEIARLVLEGLSPEAIADAIPPTVARDVADLIGTRLAAKEA